MHVFVSPAWSRLQLCPLFCVPFVAVVGLGSAAYIGSALVGSQALQASGEFEEAYELCLMAQEVVDQSVLKVSNYYS